MSTHLLGWQARHQMRRRSVGALRFETDARPWSRAPCHRVSGDKKEIMSLMCSVSVSPRQGEHRRAGSRKDLRRQDDRRDRLGASDSCSARSKRTHCGGSLPGEGACDQSGMLIKQAHQAQSCSCRSELTFDKSESHHTAGEADKRNACRRSPLCKDLLLASPARRGRDLLRATLPTGGPLLSKRAKKVIGNALVLQ
jgi:hypothetical protein